MKTILLKNVRLLLYLRTRTPVISRAARLIPVYAPIHTYGSLTVLKTSELLRAHRRTPCDRTFRQCRRTSIDSRSKLIPSDSSGLGRTVPRGRRIADH